MEPGEPRMADGGALPDAAPGTRSSRERAAARALPCLGLGVAVGLSPLEHGLRIFLWNFSSFWVPQAAVLALLLPLRPRPAIVAGAALVMALHLAAFAGWMHTLGPGQALAWLFYLFSFPGALAGAALAALVSRRRPRLSAARAGAAAAALTAIGIAVNHAVTAVATP